MRGLEGGSKGAQGEVNSATDFQRHFEAQPAVVGDALDSAI